MPLYEYSCRQCDHAFEVLLTTRTSEPESCPKCKSPEIARLIGLPAQGRVADSQPALNCRGDGPPCGAPWCGRKT